MSTRTHQSELGGVKEANLRHRGGLTLDGRYRLDRLLARGGLGAVFLGRQVSTGRTVAIKVLEVEPALVPIAERRFDNEARALASLTHPHIVTIFDSGRLVSGERYLALEYVQGPTLVDLLRATGPLPPRRAVRIAAQLARGLGQAHRLGIVHRDVKPANVMIGTGAEDHAKLIDFGLAKFVRQEERRQLPLTRQGSLLGSPHYMAPEQIVGDEVDERTDVYGVSTTLFHLLAGVPPYLAPTTAELLRAQLGAPVPRVEERNPAIDCPRALGDLLVRGMAKRPEERVGSMTELLAGLKAVWAELRTPEATLLAPLLPAPRTSAA